MNRPSRRRGRFIFSRGARGASAPRTGRIAARRAIELALIATALTACASEAGRPAAFAKAAAPVHAKILPARLRRLTNLEIERSLSALTGLDVAIAAELPPDVRQEGYTPNALQDVSSAWAARYSTLVRDLAKRAVREKIAALAPCAGAEGCKARIVSDLGRRAYRRPLDAGEQTSLEEVFAAGQEVQGTFAGGVELLLRALAESPSFLYAAEIGEPAPPGSTTRLDGYEIASSLSYMLRGGPPDDQLLDAARSGALASGEGRAKEARRLLGMSETRFQFRRFVLEWLEVDGLAQTAKSSTIFPRYETLKPHMLAETEAFADEVLVHGGASIRGLLGAGFASVDPDMARFYGMRTYGPEASVGGTGRLGVLQQASFLAAHAHEDTTSPAKRGDFVMRKLLCEKVKRPAEIGLEVVMPAPSDRLTNRQRFTAHGDVPGCAGCHGAIDSLGFTFEGFDAMGGAQASDHGLPVSTRARVTLGKRDVEIDDSASLTRALMRDERVGPCFARHAFRYFSAQADPGVEASFLALRDHLRTNERDNLFETLLAYVASDLFILREVEAP